MSLAAPREGSNTLFGSLAVDFACSVVCAFILSVMRWVLTTWLYEPLARAALPDPKKDDDAKPDVPVKRRKLKESAWKATAFGTLATLGIVAVGREPWLWDTRQLYAGITRLPADSLTPSMVILYYVVMLGFYLYSIPALLVWETRRSDFVASLSHHIVTALLIGFSYSANLMRIGAVVLLLHDICDVPLEIAKCFRYAGWEMAMNVWFGLFTLIWFASRVFYFPLVIIRSTVFESLAFAESINYPWSQLKHTYIGFNAGLIFLWILHLYWSYFIVRALLNALFGDGVSDDREEDDD